LVNLLVEKELFLCLKGKRLLSMNHEAIYSHFQEPTLLSGKDTKIKRKYAKIKKNIPI